MVRLFSLATVLATAGVITGQLTKPAISPRFDLDGTMESQLRNVLPKHAYTVTQWASGFVPKACKDQATDNSLNAADFVVYNVTYSDCADPWVICRHKTSPTSTTDIFTRMGQIPVGMRQYLQNVIAMPTSSTNVAYTVGAYSVFFGDWWHLGTMAHEFTHVLDLVALTQYVTRPFSQPFSDTSRWQTPQSKDKALPTAYAASTWQEDFAEAGRVALSDMVVSGGLESINPNATQIQNQVDTYEQYLKAVIFPTSGRCTGKAKSTPAVPVSRTSARGQIPDVGLSGEVPEIVVPEEASNWKFVYPLSAIEEEETV